MRREGGRKGEGGGGGYIVIDENEEGYLGVGGVNIK